ncbi:MAG TPA: DUF1214 domain-containing protein [Propylenella sp.]
MRSVLVLLIGVALGLTLGLWSAWLTVRSPAPIDAITIGPWQAWPNAGTTDADPYSRARVARVGEIPLGSGEGLMLLAETDDSGRDLTGACDYRVEGQTPPARLWTIVVEDADGRVVAHQSGMAALSSDVLLRGPDGSFQVSLSPHPQSGNWISTEDAPRFRLVVRLYDTNARTGTALTTLSMPRIVRRSCA